MPVLMGVSGGLVPPEPTAVYPFAAAASFHLDATANGNDLGNTGSTFTEITGKSGGGLRFTDASLLSLGAIVSGSFTAAFWARMDYSTDDAEVFIPVEFRVSSATAKRVRFEMHENGGGAGNVRCISSVEGNEDAVDVSKTPWHFCVMQWDDTEQEMRCRINATSFGATPALTDLSGVSWDILVNSIDGDLSGSDAGDIDELMVWDHLLSSGQIDWLYNSGSGRFYGVDF